MLWDIELKFCTCVSFYERQIKSCVHIKFNGRHFVSISHGGGGGVTCHDFGYGCAAGVPEPHPIHILGQVKNMTHSYTSYIENWPHSYTIFENWPHSYTIFQFYPFIYFLGEKDTPLIYFWCKNDTHSYTGRPEKYTPFQPHIYIYLYNGSYPPPPVLFLMSYICDGTDVQADWSKSCTYGRAPNAIDISEGSLMCPSKHRHGTTLFIYGYSENPPHLVATARWWYGGRILILNTPASPRGPGDKCSKMFCRVVHFGNTLSH